MLTAAAWIGGTFLFVIATLLFYLFPRVIAGAAIFALFLGSSDLGVKLGIVTVNSPAGHNPILFMLVVAIFFGWFIPGLVLDIVEVQTRWDKLLLRISGLIG